MRTAVSDSFQSVLVAFARYRPSQPPGLRVTRLHLRSLYVTTWSFAHAPYERDVRGLHRLAFRSTMPLRLREWSLFSRSDFHRLDVVSLAGHANSPAGLIHGSYLFSIYVINICNDTHHFPFDVSEFYDALTGFRTRLRRTKLTSKISCNIGVCRTPSP